MNSAPDGIVVLHDADCFCAGLGDAIAAVANGAAWAVPHTFVHRLTQEATASTLSGRPDMTVEQKPYPGIVGGGIVVARRETLLEAPLDPRFIGWGQEDQSFGFAMSCLFGEPRRGHADLIHLWHPHPPRMDRKRGSPENWALRERYDKARWNRAAMRELIEEGRHVDRNASQPAMRHHAA